MCFYILYFYPVTRANEDSALSSQKYQNGYILFLLVYQPKSIYISTHAILLDPHTLKHKHTYTHTHTNPLTYYADKTFNVIIHAHSLARSFCLSVSRRLHISLPSWCIIHSTQYVEHSTWCTYYICLHGIWSSLFGYVMLMLTCHIIILLNHMTFLYLYRIPTTDYTLHMQQLAKFFSNFLS